MGKIYVHDPITSVDSGSFLYYFLSVSFLIRFTKAGGRLVFWRNVLSCSKNLLTSGPVSIVFQCVLSLTRCTKGRWKASIRRKMQVERCLEFVYQGHLLFIPNC